MAFVFVLKTNKVNTLLPILVSFVLILENGSRSSLIVIFWYYLIIHYLLNIKIRPMKLFQYSSSFLAFSGLISIYQGRSDNILFGMIKSFSNIFSYRAVSFYLSDRSFSIASDHFIPHISFFGFIGEKISEYLSFTNAISIASGDATFVSDMIVFGDFRGNVYIHGGHG